MKKIGSVILGLEESGNTERLEEVNHWLINYASNEIGSDAQWKLYKNHFPNATLGFCQSESDVAEFFEGLGHSQIMSVIIKGRLDFGKHFIVENIDKQDDDLVCTWTVNDISELPGWAEVIDELLENFDFGWVYEDEFFERFPDLIPVEPIWTSYCPDTDITYIMKEDAETIECIGWYCGEPNNALTEHYSTKGTKAHK